MACKMRASYAPLRWRRFCEHRGEARSGSASVGDVTLWGMGRCEQGQYWQSACNSTFKSGYVAARRTPAAMQPECLM